MPRDPNTGKPRGFAWLMYADQRSTVLAVDNLNGAQVLGRTLRVDHVLNYKQLERDQETGKLKERDEQRYVDLPLVPLHRTDARFPSFAAHPEKFLKKGSDGSESDSSHGSIDPDDPMRDYLISQRREKKEKRKAEGEGGGSSESKEEKRRRKEERRRIREEREARKTRRGIDGGKRRAIEDGGRGPAGGASYEVKRSRGGSRERQEERPSSRGPRSPDRYHRSDPRSRSRYSPDPSRGERASSRDEAYRSRRDDDRDRDGRRRYDDDDKRRAGGGGDAFADLERWARGA